MSTEPGPEAIFCFDCECEITGLDELLCRTCTKHRVDRHAPTPYGVLHEYCHGSGPGGKDAERRRLSVRVIGWKLTSACRARYRYLGSNIREAAV